VGGFFFGTSAGSGVVARASQGIRATRPTHVSRDTVPAQPRSSAGLIQAGKIARQLA